MSTLHPILQSALLLSMYSIYSADTKCKTAMQSDWFWYVLFLWANENSSMRRGLEHFETRKWVPVFYVSSLQPLALLGLEHRQEQHICRLWSKYWYGINRILVDK